MSEFQFTLVLADQASVMTDDLADKLFEAGCDDATPGVSNGTPDICFSRASSSLREALISAIKQVESCGLHVSRIIVDHDESDHESELINSMLQIRKVIHSQRELDQLWQDLTHPEPLASS
jgi:molybdopterin-guanine dinucleotide biosynthesis protein A